MAETAAIAKPAGPVLDLTGLSGPVGNLMAGLFALAFTVFWAVTGWTSQQNRALALNAAPPPLIMIETLAAQGGVQGGAAPDTEVLVRARLNPDQAAALYGDVVPLSGQRMLVPLYAVDAAPGTIETPGLLIWNPAEAASLYALTKDRPRGPTGVDVIINGEVLPPHHLSEETGRAYARMGLTRATDALLIRPFLRGRAGEYAPQPLGDLLFLPGIGALFLLYQVISGFLKMRHLRAARRYDRHRTNAGHGH